MDDLISRQAVIDLFKKYQPYMAVKVSEFGIALKELPSAQPERWDTCFSCPLSHGCPLINGCTNDQAEQYAGEIPTDCPFEKKSAQPERKTGKWLIRRGIADAQCSECKMYFNDVYDMDNSDAFCRHCGAKMEGLKVVE